MLISCLERWNLRQRTHRNMKLTSDKCQCTVCKRYFNSTRAFDKHRTGPFSHNVLSRECRTDEQMIAKGMSHNAKGLWITSKRVKFTAAQRGFSDLNTKPMGQ